MKFEINKTYQTISIGDQGCIYKFPVVKRTEKNVWIVTSEGTKMVKIHFDGENEYIYPIGHYSMCPILRANRTNKTN